MKLSRVLVIAGVLLVGSRAPTAAQDKFRVASGGSSTAIHAKSTFA
jgi:hypothetical protein